MLPEDPPHLGVETLRVSLPDGRILRFGQTFYIGRDPACEVQIEDSHVSRRHAVVSFVEGTWSVTDLRSRNGVFVDGHPIEVAPVGDGLTLTLGDDGPSLMIAPEIRTRTATPKVSHRSQREPAAVEDYADRYFRSADSGPVGDRTLMIRRAFQQVQEKQRRRYRWLVTAVALAGLCAAGYAYYGHRKLLETQGLAQEIFYSMKALDVNIATVEQSLAKSGNSQALLQVAQYMDQRRQMEGNYDRFLTALYDRRLSEKERLILKVTRTFGECELAAPPEYVREVSRYIARWQSTGRFSRAVKTAQDLGYTEKIVEEFAALNLPPQFFYLAMQESDFDAFRSGPRTNWGIAKGMWQFIPDTGRRYGLALGPMVNSPMPDPQDERLKWEKATNAAARYVKEIYATDAQASGLLVIASYNWGERRVIDLLKTMPANPRERNFWKLLEKHRDHLPPETYNYVFSIVSAAVIGENPRLFGFPFDSPLGFLGQS